MALLASMHTKAGQWMIQTSLEQFPSVAMAPIVANSPSALSSNSAASPKSKQAENSTHPQTGTGWAPGMRHYFPNNLNSLLLLFSNLGG